MVGFCLLWDVVRQYSLFNPVQRKVDLPLVSNPGYDLWEEVPYIVILNIIYSGIVPDGSIRPRRTQEVS